MVLQMIRSTFYLWFEFSASLSLHTCAHTDMIELFNTKLLVEEVSYVFHVVLTLYN